MHYDIFTVDNGSLIKVTGDYLSYGMDNTYTVTTINEQCESLVRAKFFIYNYTRDDYDDLSREDLYIVKFPKLMLVESTAVGRAPHILSSHDDIHWHPVSFPHVYHGNLQSCMQLGKFQLDREHVASNLTSYVFNYSSGLAEEYWGIETKAFGEDEIYPEDGVDIKHCTESLHLKDYMEQWEQLSYDDLNRIVGENYDKFMAEQELMAETMGEAKKLANLRTNEVARRLWFT